MLLNTKELLLNARNKGYAVAAFNVFNMETAQSAIRSAERQNMPVILALGERYLNSVCLKSFSAMARAMAEKSVTGVALHLDHAYELESIVMAIRNGFTSVMYDGSKLSLQDNIKTTREIVKISHLAGVSVEAEIGSVSKGEFSDEEEGDGRLTDPQEAYLFVNETGVDFLAASIGTVHGMYKGEPNIDLDRLKEIKDAVNVPLVLHGGSGTPDAIISRAIELGICKINVNTEVSISAMEALRRFLQLESTAHLSKAMNEMQRDMEKVMERYVKLFSHRTG